MTLLSNAVIILAVVFLPRLMVLLSKRVRALGYMGPVFLCYACGFLLSYLIPEKGLAMTLSEVLVPIAIPLILFSADLASVRRLAKPTLISFALVCVSVFSVAALSFFVFRGVIPEANKYAGMIIGLYTGGTPNLMAIGLALGVSDTNIVLANTVDMLVGGIYFLLLISVMPRFAARFLPPFQYAGTDTGGEGSQALADSMQHSFVPDKERFSLRALLRRVPVLLLGVLCLAAAAGLALLITGELNVVIVMLVVTTLGIALSFVRRVREAPGSYAAGQYLIYMFSVGIGISFDLSMVTMSMLSFLGMFALAQFGAVLLHLLLCKLCRIDGHTALITSTAGIYGPAFIVPTANALKNREVVLPGLICGILGYAIGNYFGISTALLLGLMRG